jgi:hypothetical protein
MGLREDLGPGPTALDTALFIYYIEENEAFLPLVAPIFERSTRRYERQTRCKSRRHSRPVVPGS